MGASDVGSLVPSAGGTTVPVATASNAEPPITPRLLPDVSRHSYCAAGGPPFEEKACLKRLRALESAVAVARGLTRSFVVKVCDLGGELLVEWSTSFRQNPEYVS